MDVKERKHRQERVALDQERKKLADEKKRRQELRDEELLRKATREKNASAPTDSFYGTDNGGGGSKNLKSLSSKKPETPSAMRERLAKQAEARCAMEKSRNKGSKMLVVEDSSEDEEIKALANPKAVPKRTKREKVASSIEGSDDDGVFMRPVINKAKKLAGGDRGKGKEKEKARKRRQESVSDDSSITEAEYATSFFVLRPRRF